MSTALNSLCLYRNNQSLDGDYEGYVVYPQSPRYPRKFIGFIGESCEHFSYTNINNLMPKTRQFLISLEDKRFLDHGPFDLYGIVRAILINTVRMKIVQGGSTLTQQIARNILRNSKRTFSNKIKEAHLALHLERHYTKDQLLELYLNSVYWGKNIFGIRSASIEYFSKEPWELSKAELVLLLAILKGPNYYLSNPTKMAYRYQVAIQALHSNKTIDLKTYAALKHQSPIIVPSKTQVVGQASCHYITQSVNKSRRIIYSTIDADLQDSLSSYFAVTPSDLNVMIIKKGKVRAFYSQYGSDYLFCHRTNVGSTLKPFIYYLLLESGVKENDTFSTVYDMSDGYVVNEVNPPLSSTQSITEALIKSTNIPFLNACHHVGLCSILKRLSAIIDIPYEDLTVASVLGATNSGLSLHHLSIAYDRFFNSHNLDSNAELTKSTMNRIVHEKLAFTNPCLYMKTGTTDGYRDRFAIIGDGEVLYAFLRNGNDIGEQGKYGNLLVRIKQFLQYLSVKKYTFKYSWGSCYE